jgi:uncharacterized surface protein with fasciclin (FAS1) repeats
MINGMIKTTALSLSLGLVAATAHAASIVDTAKQTDQLGTFSEVIASAGLDQQLAGDGPFTVFAPTDQAFERLPQSVRDQVMKQEHQVELIKILQHHVVQGLKLMAKDVLGKQSKVGTVSGDTLTVDGTTEVVLLMPTGLTVTEVGDRVVVERKGVAVPAGQIEVRDQHVRKAGGDRQNQDQQARSRQGQQAGQQGQTSAARTTTAAQSDMPMTEHQQQVMKSAPGEEQQQTAAEGGAPMPATKHQRQVLAEDELPGEQQQSYEQARVEGKPDLLREATVVEPDIQADNGVIHLIDAILVPQSVLLSLNGTKSRS